MSGSCRETHLDVREWWEALLDVRQLSGIFPGYLGVVGRLSRIFGSGREDLLNVRKWSEDPPECLGVVERVSQMSGSGWETLPLVRVCW